ncbi:hypothetical protein HDU76_003807, partial [Blyttiomyces sp. JEL0837]
MSKDGKGGKETHQSAIRTNPVIKSAEMKEDNASGDMAKKTSALKGPKNRPSREGQMGLSKTAAVDDSDDETKQKNSNFFSFKNITNSLVRSKSREHEPIDNDSDGDASGSDGGSSTKKKAKATLFSESVNRIFHEEETESESKRQSVASSYRPRNSTNETTPLRLSDGNNTNNNNYIRRDGTATDNNGDDMDDVGEGNEDSYPVKGPSPVDDSLQATSGYSYNRSVASSFSIGTSRWPNAREISETVGSKSKEIVVIALVVLTNIGLFLLGHAMSQGLIVNLSPTVITYAGGVTIEITLLITNALTAYALDAGTSIYIATLLTRRKGYSMAVCGYMQTPQALRLSFTNQLSLNSPCRKNLQRAAYFFIIVELIKILSPIGATGVQSELVREITDQVTCLQFDSSRLRDRQFPTIQSTNGVAEFIYGNALGCMRSERVDCLTDPNGSTFVFGPQLDGAIGSGDTIIGPGYTALIATTCKCYNVTDKAVIARGLLTDDDRVKLQQAISTVFAPFLVLSSNINSTETDGIRFNMALGNVQTCGGYSSAVMPICSTRIYNATDAMISSSFATDGTPASIALVDQQQINVMDVQTITHQALATSYKTILPPGQVYQMVGTVPGMLNALLYWTSSDLISVNPSLLEPGIETMVSMILRAGIQRNFEVYGSTCPRLPIARQDQCIVKLTGWGRASVFAIAGVQLALSFMALVLSMIWYIHPSPLTPAIRVIRDPTYFMSVLCDSSFGVFLNGTCNAQRHVIWQALDTVVRIGETLEALDENVGKIKMDSHDSKPGLKSDANDENTSTLSFLPGSSVLGPLAPLSVESSPLVSSSQIVNGSRQNFYSEHSIQPPPSLSGFDEGQFQVLQEINSTAPLMKVMDAEGTTVSNFSFAGEANKAEEGYQSLPSQHAQPPSSTTTVPKSILVVRDPHESHHMFGHHAPVNPFNQMFRSIAALARPHGDHADSHATASQGLSTGSHTHEEQFLQTPSNMGSLSRRNTRNSVRTGVRWDVETKDDTDADSTSTKGSNDISPLVRRHSSGRKQAQTEEPKRCSKTNSVSDVNNGTHEKRICEKTQSRDDNSEKITSTLNRRGSKDSAQGENAGPSTSFNHERNGSQDSTKGGNADIASSNQERINLSDTTEDGRTSSRDAEATSDDEQPGYHGHHQRKNSIDKYKGRFVQKVEQQQPQLYQPNPKEESIDSTDENLISPFVDIKNTIDKDGIKEDQVIKSDKVEEIVDMGEEYDDTDSPKGDLKETELDEDENDGIDEGDDSLHEINEIKGSKTSSSREYSSARRQTPSPYQVRKAKMDSRMGERSGSLFHASSSTSVRELKYPNAREISETFGSKSKEIVFILIAALLNVFLILVGRSMATGVRVKLGPDVITYTGGVTIEITLLLLNILTLHALDLGVSVLAAILLTRRKGYSMAVCGYMQTAPVNRFAFTNQLSLNSPCRNGLSRLSIIFLISEALKLLSPIGATGVLIQTVREVSDQVTCLVFNPLILQDRGYPTLQSTEGVAEFIYGNAMGCMRSERSDCLIDPNMSTFVFGPQLDGVIGTGDTIIGPGFLTLIGTTCKCHDIAEFGLNSTVISPQDQEILITAIQSVKTTFLYVPEHRSVDEKNGEYHFSLVVGNLQICGGFSPYVMPICPSRITNATDIIVSSSFSTDGTPASIAVIDQQMVSVLAKQTITISAMATAFESILHPMTVHPLTSTVAGMINPILFWTSSSLVSVNPSFIEAGLETSISMILRAGIQRNFDVYGTTCPRMPVSRDDECVIKLSLWGQAAVFTSASVQLAVSIFAFVCGSYWYFHHNPLSPVIRIIRDPTYFLTVLLESGFALTIEGTSNAERHVIWQLLDTTVRIGEGLTPLEDPN